MLDRIIVMKDGQVAEQGTHDQLIEAGALYSELWNGMNLFRLQFRNYTYAGQLTSHSPSVYAHGRGQHGATE